MGRVLGSLRQAGRWLWASTLWALRIIWTIQAALWTYMVATERTAMSIIGRLGIATAPDDLPIALQYAVAGLDWLFATPWWAPAILAGIMTAVLFGGPISAMWKNIECADEKRRKRLRESFQIQVDKAVPAVVERAVANAKAEIDPVLRSVHAMAQCLIEMDTLERSHKQKMRSAKDMSF